MLDRLLMFLGLRRERYLSDAVAQASKEGFVAGYRDGYLIGRAHGELIGRELQVLELQQEFGFETNRNVFNAGDAIRYGARLKH